MACIVLFARKKLKEIIITKFIIKSVIKNFPKMIERQARDNQNLANLKNQMKDMSQDFEDMKNARIESKRQLEQRFTNTYT